MCAIGGVMNVPKNKTWQSGKKYSFVHAHAGLAKRNIHTALRKPLSGDSKGREEASFRIICKFGGELADVALPAMRAADFLRGL